MNQLLNGKNIVKIYGKGQESQPVLNGVNVEISQGEFVAVMGPSGSGKSTLMYALSGMEKIEDGSICFDGKELQNCNEKQSSMLRRQEMGFVFQQPGMLANLNLLDNILLPSVHDHKKDYEELAEKAKELMQRTGIAELADRTITEVSGGQLQRAGICRALMNEPKILFADEPTGALNSKTSFEIMELFQEINQNGAAVFLVTHDAKVASYAGRVLFLVDGQVKTELNFTEENLHTTEEKQEAVLCVMQEMGV